MYSQLNNVGNLKHITKNSENKATTHNHFKMVPRIPFIFISLLNFGNSELELYQTKKSVLSPTNFPFKM